MSISSSSSASAVAKGPWKNSRAWHRAPAPLGARLNVASSTSITDGQVGRRIGMRQAAADGAAVADLKIADVLGALDDERKPLAQEGGLEQVAVGGGGADAGALPVLRDPAQLGEVAHVHQPRRLRQPEAHHRQQAVAAGEDLAAVAGRQRVERVPERHGAHVVEARRESSRVASRSRRPAWIAAHTRAGVSGLSMCTIPSGESASHTAFTRHAAEPIVPGLAAALHAERVDRRRRDRVVGLDARHLAGLGHRVVHHGAGERAGPSRRRSQISCRPRRGPGSRRRGSAPRTIIGLMCGPQSSTAM